jgi:hypothetical protein
MNAQKQAEMIATAARHPETDGFKCILPRIWASITLGAKMPIQAGPE